MKYYILLLALALLCFGSVQGQNIGYSYDDSGNRTSRYYIYLYQYKSATLEETDSANFDNAEVSFRDDLSDEDVAEEGKQIFYEQGLKSTVVYPNPTAGLLRIKMEGYSSDVAVKVLIYTTAGKQILKREYLSNEFEIDITDHASGSYLLDLHVNGEKQVYTIIKE